MLTIPSLLLKKPLAAFLGKPVPILQIPVVLLSNLNQLQQLVHVPSRKPHDVKQNPFPLGGTQFHHTTLKQLAGSLTVAGVKTPIDLSHNISG
jgi:hypothetical protein